MQTVLTRHKLYELGLSRSAVEANIDGRRWRALNELVVCRHNGPLTSDEQIRAVYLSAPRPAAICAWTALIRADVRIDQSPGVHLLVRRGARPTEVADIDVDVHESRRFDASDVRMSDGIGMTRIARSAVDAAAWSAVPRDAARVVLAVVQQRRATPDMLAAELAAAGRIRHRRLLESVLADAAGGAQALSEVGFVAFCRRHGFPPPRLQVRCDANGRRRYLDAEFVSRSGRVVSVEIDGGVHLTLRVRWRDTMKDNDAVMDGRLVLRFPSVAIYTDDPVAIAQLRRALAS